MRTRLNLVRESLEKSFSFRSRITLFKNELESKEEQCEILQETLDEIKTKKVK